jgi:glycerol kinase
LISQVLSDCGGKPNVSVAGGIRVTREQRIAWDDTSTNPIINSISCGDDLTHDCSTP